MNFRPTLRKCVVSIVIIVIWYVFLIFTSVDCRLVSVPCMPNCGKDFSFLPKCCGCVPFNENLKDLLIIITPGIVVYIILSLIQKKK